MKEKMDDPKDVVPIKRRKERHLQNKMDSLDDNKIKAFPKDYKMNLIQKNYKRINTKRKQKEKQQQQKEKEEEKNSSRVWKERKNCFCFWASFGRAQRPAAGSSSRKNAV